jgi:hypothetical protein
MSVSVNSERTVFNNVGCLYLPVDDGDTYVTGIRNISIRLALEIIVCTGRLQKKKD